MELVICSRNWLLGLSSRIQYPVPNRDYW